MSQQARALTKRWNEDNETKKCTKNETRLHNDPLGLSPVGMLCNFCALLWLIATNIARRRFAGHARKLGDAFDRHSFRLALRVQFENDEALSFHAIAPHDAECVVVPVFEIAIEVWTKL